MLRMIPTLPLKSNDRLNVGVVAYEIPQHLDKKGQNCPNSGRLVPESDIEMPEEIIGAGRRAVSYEGTYTCSCGQKFLARITDPKEAIEEFRYPPFKSNRTIFQ